MRSMLRCMNTSVVRPPMIHTHMGGCAKAPRAAAGAAVSWNRSTLPQYRVAAHNMTGNGNNGTYGGVRSMASNTGNGGSGNKGSAASLFQTAATIPASIQLRTGGAASLLGVANGADCSVHGSSSCGCGPTPTSIASSIAANISATGNSIPVREFGTKVGKQSKSYTIGQPGDGTGSEIEDIFNKNRFWANQLKSINPYDILHVTCHFSIISLLIDD